MSGTGFYWHERCFWHDQGAIGVFSAPGEFLQPQAASESPESKRRLKNILEVSGLIDELYVVKPPALHAGQLGRSDPLGGLGHRRRRRRRPASRYPPTASRRSCSSSITRWYAASWRPTSTG